jgi:hypothetical protein
MASAVFVAFAITPSILSRKSLRVSFAALILASLFSALSMESTICLMASLTSGDKTGAGFGGGSAGGAGAT